MLFLVFINDFIHSSEALDFSIFADDTCGSMGSDSLGELREMAIRELCAVRRWLIANHIQANVKKTHFMIFSGRVKIDYSIRITFSNKNLMQKSSTKMLGVIIDDRLSWSEHINAVNGKISKINGILFKLSKYLNSNTLKIIYNS